MDPKSIDRIFWDAANWPCRNECAAYLDRACGDDAGLRRKVEQLLQARSKAENFLEAPAVQLVPSAAEIPVCEGPGTVIGPYKLLEQIGEGGFGLVFMAEQQQPVRRKVAVKVIKPGMDTRQVIARFEAERHSLALMDHPHIARVLEVGETATGRPYFAMELVPGSTDHRILRQEQSAAPATPGTFPDALPGRAARPPERHHSPRSEAVQRAGDAARRQGSRQGDRLRRRQGVGAATDRQDPVYRFRANWSARLCT